MKNRMSLALAALLLVSTLAAMPAFADGSTGQELFHFLPSGKFADSWLWCIYVLGGFTVVDSALYGLQKLKNRK